MPETVQGLLAARLDSLEPFERQLVAHAAVLGRTFWESALEPVAVAGGEPFEAALAIAAREGHPRPRRGRGSRGERELAFKHVLIRDVAYEMLPKAVRARKHAEVGAFIQRRAGGRGEGTVALVAEHYARAAAYRRRGASAGSELAELRARALEFARGARVTRPARCTPTARRWLTIEAAIALADANEQTAQRIAEKRGDVALRLGRVEPAIEGWLRCLDYYSEDGDLQHVAELHRKIGAALAHKGERKSAIEHHQQGINLIKDGAPSLALVRLYEEAAWLYMQVGDNMLAIYASEKALRLAENLGEPRAASRAHGIFGRVFGRIGDGVKARENLERAVELARESDAAETILALLALGHHLEHAEGDYARCRGVLRRGAARSPSGSAMCRRRSSCTRRSPSWPSTAATGRGRAHERTPAPSWPNARAWSESCACRTICAGRLRWRDGDWEASVRLFVTAHELAEQVGWSEVAFSALSGLALTLRDRGDLAGAESALA